MASAAFGTKKRPAGKQYRGSGDVGNMLTDIYKDVEAGFVAIELPVYASTVDSISLPKVAVGLFDATNTTSNRTVAAHAFGPTLPIGAVITRAYYKVLTTFTSTAGGTDKAVIALGVTGATAGLVAAVAIETGTPWDAEGIKSTLADGTGAACVPPPSVPAGLAAAGQMLATITTQAVTGGILKVYAEYIVV